MGARALWAYCGRRMPEWQQHLLRCYEAFRGAASHGGPRPAGLQHRVKSVGPAALPRRVRTHIRLHGGHALRFHKLDDACLSCGRVSRSGRGAGFSNGDGLATVSIPMLVAATQVMTSSGMPSGEVVSACCGANGGSSWGLLDRTGQVDRRESCGDGLSASVLRRRCTAPLGAVGAPSTEEGVGRLARPAWERPVADPRARRPQWQRAPCGTGGGTFL